MNNFSDLLFSLPDEIKFHGGHNENKKQVPIRAGKLNILYENAGLRYISAGKIEIIRRIYPAVRDKSWLTIRQSVEDEHIIASGKSFRIKTKCKYRSEEIDFQANYLYEGTEESTITMTMQGEALSTFEKNRIGFCILHPIEELTGKKCFIGHPDGSSEEFEFPEDISPHQVFRNVKSMKWFTGKGICSIDLDGDIFETEDQRNWSDTSYKTYPTPLYIPFPVTIKKGTRIIQTVKIKFESEDKGLEVEEGATIVRLFPDESFKIPSIGIAKSSNPGSLRKGETKILRALRFDHYRIDLHLFDNKWQERASEGYNEATDLGYEIEFALFFDDSYTQQIIAFMTWLTKSKAQISSILLFHKLHQTTPENLVSYVTSRIKELYPDIKTGSGTNLNFVNINRNRPAGSASNILCFPVHPQEHSSDNLSLVENIEAQKYTIASARQFAPGIEIFISPVTIQRRFNAHNSFIELPLQGSDVPQNIDSRLMSLFGGCWTAGSMKYLFEAGADSITYYETKGERGIIQGENDSLWPSVFPAAKGMIFPVFHVFSFLLTNKSFRVIRSKSSKPLSTDCLALSDGKQARIILVNFTGSVQPLRFECCSGLFRIRSLDASSFVDAACNFRWTGIENEKITRSQNLFNIEPYSINFIEGWVKH